MKKLFSHWTGAVLIFLPLGLLIFDAAVLFSEWRQPESEKAVRRVRESKSRKENFTVQQYLYATVYHRKDEGEAITIEGWRAEPDATAATNDFLVSFVYTDASGQHIAQWQANSKSKKVTPKNQEADDLSWQ
jgi:hypothetical protein